MTAPECMECGAELPEQTGRGRRRRYCADCARLRRNAACRKRYADDEAFRAAQLERRHERYDANIERERERAKDWYRANRERKIAAVTKARQANG